MPFNEFIQLVFVIKAKWLLILDADRSTVGHEVRVTIH